MRAESFLESMLEEVLRRDDELLGRVDKIVANRSVNELSYSDVEKLIEKYNNFPYDKPKKFRKLIEDIKDTEEWQIEFVKDLIHGKSTREVEYACQSMSAVSIINAACLRTNHYNLMGDCFVSSDLGLRNRLGADLFNGDALYAGAYTCCDNYGNYNNLDLAIIQLHKFNDKLIEAYGEKKYIIEVIYLDRNQLLNGYYCKDLQTAERVTKHIINKGISVFYRACVCKDAEATFGLLRQVKLDSAYLNC